MNENKLTAKGSKSSNAINGNSTQVSGANSTINYFGYNNEDMEKYYKGNHIKAADIIKSQRAIIENLQRQIDRMQTHIDVIQDIKNKLVIMLMQQLDKHENGEK